MEMVPVSVFVPTLRQLVNVPIPTLMDSALVKAAQQFCRDSQVVVLRRQFDQVFANQQLSIVRSSSINRQTGEQLKAAAILEANADGEPLTPGRDYHLLDRDTLYCLTDITNLNVVAAVEPIQGASALPASLHHDYHDGICAGAASLLYQQPDSDWFSLELAEYHQRTFNDFIRQAARFRLEASPDLSYRNPTRTREFF